MLESILHFFGFCGEPHLKLLDLAPFSMYITENIKNVSLYVKNTWHFLN